MNTPSCVCCGCCDESAMVVAEVVVDVVCEVCCCAVDAARVDDAFFLFCVGISIHTTTRVLEKSCHRHQFRAL